jgi:hypothetical protein
MSYQRKAQLRRWTFALGVSTGAMIAAAPAFAQCAPDPTVANATTNCAGADADGLTVNTTNTQVVVASGASVRPGSAVAAIRVSATNATLSVNGLVDGTGKPGIAVIAGPAVQVPCDPYAGASVGSCIPGTSVTSYPFATATINVGQGGTVTGAQALQIGRDPSNPSGYVSVAVSNAGTMAGTGGSAIVANVANNSSVTVNNLAGGSIAGISGTIGSIGNAGLIDGGTGNAIVITMPSVTVSNSGRIVSSGTAATVSSAGALALTNAAGATLGGSALAVNVGGALSLTNEGTINGSVVSTAAAGQNSVVDTRKGVINGNLTLGAGDDTLRAVFDIATGKIASVTGSIDGGAGIDTVAIGIAGDATLGGVALPANFELLGVDLSNNATVVLAPGFNAAGIAMTGSGSVVNQADLVSNGPAVVATATLGSLKLTNTGSITASLGAGQIAVGSPTELANSGTVTANGGAGVRVGSLLTNSGGIVATGTAAEVVFGTLENSGTIRSTGGVGAAISSQASYTRSTNNGTISGATAGVRLTTATLVNNGTISGGINGVELNGSATLMNAAGGTVSGGTDAVRNTGSQAVVVNAGTINGNVNLASSTTFDSSNDIFFNTGGTVNGTIRLGGGDDRLVVDLVTPAGRPIGGATGGVDAGSGYDTLHYRVNADASATLALGNGFEALAYELDNRAALTLNALTPITTTIGLTGNGTVTLSGSIAASDRSLIDATALTAAQLTGGGAGPAQALTIINNGTLSLATSQTTSFNLRTAINAGLADVTNNGAIVVANAPGSYFPASGMFGGHNVTNAGTITLTGGGTAITNAQNIFNSGAVDAAGSGAKGVSSFTSLENSGTIRADENAVEAGNTASRISNSGTIESRTATAVVLNSGARLTNEVGGTIQGAKAVDLATGAVVVNRGMIIGDVTAYALSTGNATYVADGGTLAGNLAFGAAGDVFVTFGAGTGVSGTIDGGAGRDLFGQVVTGSRSVALDGNAQVVNFEDALVHASGAGTIATVTATNAFAGMLYVSGNGTVVNTATVGGGVTSGAPYSSGILLPGGGLQTLASFENRGVITSGVSVSAPTLTNSGSIAGGVALSNPGPITLNNSGAISGDVVLGTAGDRVENSGSMTGTVSLDAGNDVFVQHGGGALGVIDGSAGTDSFVFDTLGNNALAIGQIKGFERLETRGSGNLTLSGGAFAFDQVVVGSDLTIAAGVSLTTPQLGFASTGGRLSVSGRFAGSVTGGAGTDRIDISGGTAEAPVAFGTISDVEALRMSAGFATIAGMAKLGDVALSGGRLVGLAGSTISAPTITVGSGATFGSAGTVNGNVVVNGTLSPGASPGTMTVNGNVSLASTSVSLFEITATVSDKLLVNGSLAIAQGATLQLSADQTVKPGQTLELIAATGGITGSFTNILRSASLFGAVVQDGRSVSLLGAFANDPTFTPQVQSSIAYVNSVLMSGQASAGLLSAASQLATASGASNPAAFGRLTPEAYASASQLTVEHGLALADAARSEAFAANRDTPGLFTFASALAGTGLLERSQGTSPAKTNSYGFLGGIGWAGDDWSIGGFVGYLDSRQNLRAIDVRTDADGVVAGIHGRWSSGEFGLKATIAYDGSNATTRRTLPGGSATGDYGLHGWTADTSIDYAVPLSANWMARPSLGVTTMRLSRDRVVETGGNAFALDVAHRRDDAVFIDGAVALRGGMRADATIRPYVSVGVRYQAEGRTPYALAALGGGNYGLLGAGASRAPVLATGTLGSDIVLSSRLVMFGAVSGEAGNADRRASARAGLRLAF